MTDYLTRLICAAILCALVDALAGSGAGSGMRRLTAGIFLVLVTFSVPTELSRLELDPDRFRQEAEAAASEGAFQAREAQADIITSAVEAYIGTKAGSLGLEVTARVMLDEELRPFRVELSGAGSAPERQRLMEILTGELAVRKENVVWMETYQSSE